MKNIFRIFYRDFKRVSTNVVAVVIVIGLSIIPSLYAWFNILSNWDPYGPESTSNLKIAVYSADEGIDMTLSANRLHLTEVHKPFRTGHIPKYRCFQ